MSKFQLLSCDVALGGDVLNVVARHAFNPVTFPELLILRYLHGEQSVTNVFDVGYVEREDESEVKRLRETYAAKVYDTLFPGAASRLPYGDNRYRRRVEGTLINPVAPVVDVQLHDATVAPGVQDAPPVDYAVQTQAPAEYVPAEPEPVPVPVPAPVPEYTPVPAPAPVSRRPVPVTPGS